MEGTWPREASVIVGFQKDATPTLRAFDSGGLSSSSLAEFVLSPGVVTNPAGTLGVAPDGSVLVAGGTEIARCKTTP